MLSDLYQAAQQQVLFGENYAAQQQTICVTSPPFSMMVTGTLASVHAEHERWHMRTLAREQPLVVRIGSIWLLRASAVGRAGYQTRKKTRVDLHWCSYSVDRTPCCSNSART